MKFNKLKFYEDYKEHIQNDGFIYVWNKKQDSSTMSVENYVNEYHFNNPSEYPTIVYICHKHCLDCDFADLMESYVEKFGSDVANKFYNDDHEKITDCINAYLKTYYEYVPVQKVYLKKYISGNSEVYREVIDLFKSGKIICDIAKEMKIKKLDVYKIISENNKRENA